MKRYFFLLGWLLLATSVFAQTETAQRLYQQATADRTKMRQFLSQDFSAVDSTSMHDLAVLFYRDKDYRSAGACWEIALQKVRKFGKAYEQILNALTAAYSELNDPNKMQWLMEVVEEHNRHELTKPCNDYKGKLERAQYYIMHGDEAEAREQIRQSIELCQSEEQLIEVEEAYARILFDVRDFLSCAQYFQSAARRRKKLGDVSLQMGTDMYWAAQNYLLASRYPEAEQCAREVIACFKGQKNEEEKEYYMKGLSSLGNILFCQQKDEEALEVYRAAADGYAAWKSGSELLADALEDMAKAEVRLKNFDEAGKHYRAALDLYRKLDIDTKYSNVYSSLIVCLRKAGANAAADSMELEAENQRKEVYQRILDSELPSLAAVRKYLGSMAYTNSLNTIAGCYFGVDDYGKSAEYYSMYAGSLRDMLRERFVLMTEEDRQRVWEEQRKNIDEFCFGIATLPDSATRYMQQFVPTFYDLELLSKGIMLNSSIEFEKVLNSLPDKHLVKIWNQIKENQEQIEHLQTSVSDENLQRVLALKQANIPLEQELMQGCLEVKDFTEYLSYTWKDVQCRLGEEDVAIEFTMVQLSPLDKDSYLLALILSSTGEPVMEVVSTRAIIRNLAEKDDLYDNAAYSGWFWGGALKRHVEGKKRIFFAPNNMLSSIAVEYLKEGDRPFSEGREVYRLSSTKELCKVYRPSASKEVCIFGDVDYQSAGTAEQRSGYGRLPFSRPEIEAVAKSLKKHYTVNMYEGDKATEEAFRALSGNSPALLHISSHGEYNGDEQTSEDAAMHLSILALAGSNLTDLPEEADGFVSAADVAGMNLHQCDMAVLSACYTGVGMQGADGIFGLQRGFKNAGVHTLLMSLKSVSDEATCKLMTSFYGGLAKGLSKREALVEAQRFLRMNGYPEGREWAPFILLDAF